MILPIVKYGNPILHQMAKPVISFDKKLLSLSKNMIQTMYAAQGVGLAAPQVGMLTRLLVIDPTAGEKKKAFTVLVNPKIISVEGDQFEEEGCLSIPNFSERVHRAQRVVVSARGIDNKEQVVKGEGLLSRILIHEIDHLNGVLFIDHLSAIKRDIIKRKIRKKVRHGEW